MAQAIFYVNGVPKSSANCGDQLYLDIPGFPQVWMTQFQNGGLQYDGLYQLPSPPYALSCARDVGTYQGTAYQVINGQKGAVIANWTFVVGNANATQGTPTTTASGLASQQCLSGLCGPSGQTSPAVVATGSPGPGGSTSVIATGGPGVYVQPSNSPQQAQVVQPQALSPFGDLPGTPPPTATAGGLPGGQAGAPGANPTPTGFNVSGFIQSPLFLLLVGLLILVYFLTQKKGG